MKLSFLFFLCLSMTFRSIGQIPCERLPKKNELLTSLNQKPINDVSIRDYQLNCNVDSSVLSRVMYLLRWQWTKSETIKYVYTLAENEKLDVSDSTDFKAFKQKVDSVVIKLKIDPGLTLLPAKLDVHEAVPFLEKALKDTGHYHKYYVELALARLGNKIIARKLIEQLNNNAALNGSEWMMDAGKKVTRLLFIASQESIAKISDFLDTSKVRVKTSRGGIVKNAVEIVWFLSNVIKNKDFQSYAKWVEAYNFEQIDDRLILYCKDWLIANKGKYEINREYCLL